VNIARLQKDLALRTRLHSLVDIDFREDESPLRSAWVSSSLSFCLPVATNWGVHNRIQWAFQT